MDAFEAYAKIWTTSEEEAVECLSDCIKSACDGVIGRILNRKKEETELE